MGISKFLKTAAFATLLACFGSTWAITDGGRDCLDNAANINCQNPNVVSLSGFKPDPDRNDELAAYGRCTGSVLKVTEDMLIILTAGHCSQRYAVDLAGGEITNLGVSFDALIHKFPGSETGWGTSQYLLGGKPLLNKHYAPSPNAFNVQYDFGLIAFPLQNGFATTAGGKLVNVSLIGPVQLPPEGFLNGFQTNVTAFASVGYGTGSVFDETGKRDTPVIKTNFAEFGIRNFATNTIFRGFQGPNQNLMHGSQNPARDHNGTCGGDSGGPQFYGSGNQKFVISVTSSGDAMCRANATSARLDIDEAQDFIEQCAYAVDSMSEYENCDLGCTAKTITTKGLCGN